MRRECEVQFECLGDEPHRTEYRLYCPFKRKKQRNGDSETTSSDEEGRVYGIDQIKIGKASNNLYTDPDSILVQRRCFQMAHNKMTC